jgi:hypothetical protein
VGQVSDCGNPHHGLEIATSGETLLYDSSQGVILYILLVHSLPFDKLRARVLKV